MLEKLGKIIRDLFVHGPKSLDQPPATEVGKPINDKVEAPAPTPTPTVEKKPTVKSNIVVAPIKKERATKKVESTTETTPVVKPKTTRAKNPSTPKK